MKKFNNLAEIILQVADQLKPPERISVSQAAEAYRFVNQPGAYVGPWKNATTPYMVEPMDMIASRTHKRMAFCGPAQSGKTDSLVINGLVYSIRVDPLDTLLYCPTIIAARDFSMRRVDRLHRHSPEVGKMLLNARDADNKFDKQYTTGMILSLSHPSVTELAGRPVGRVILTDYDRMPDDVGGDGNAFDLASMRTTTFGSYAMCVAESSPSRDIIDPNWISSTPHEAPPCTGIMSLYNRGDRRRWQWPCLECGTWFEGEFKLLQWENRKGMSNLEKAETVRMACPHCGSLIHPNDRYEMQQFGIWVPEGCHVDQKGHLKGEPRRTDFVSYWLKGVAASFNNWRAMVVKYLDAEDEFARTFSEDALKKFWNTDSGEPYKPKSMDSVRLPEALKSRAVDLEYATVPEGVRFLVAAVDVQQHKFVVQVHGIMPGYPFDAVVIDRFDITKSARLDDDGDPKIISPAAYLEDWDQLIDKVINRAYPLADGSGRMMRVKMTGCDSGGKAGVTDKAYDFYRKIRKENLHGRFVLLKGDHTASNPRTRLATPDSQQKNNKSAARGDIPVLMINSNVMKDALNGRLDCMEPGKGMIYFPNWLGDSFYAELCAETRDEKGWHNFNKVRNEAWDLLYYLLGLCVSPKVIAIESVNWDNPPGWAKEWDHNDLVSEKEAEIRFTNTPKSSVDFAALANELA